jgi:asparagine synthase (glutamine-hydrolysing)
MMCGIVGAAWTGDGRKLVEDVLRMTAVLRHRGPDADGFYFTPPGRGPGAALGHRRLSIIDVAGGRQPLANEDRSVWVTFNGEIYNYRELRPLLESRGHRFATDCDTEVIVHAYEEWGDGCVDRFRGMFAFGIWDERRGRLLLARDRLGQKPLFYREDAGRLLFASELKSLLQLPDAPRELDPSAVNAYLLYQYVPHPQCILRGYRKLPPAHRAVYEGGRLTVSRYWSPPFDEPPLNLPNDEWRERLRQTLSEAVRLRMRSDVPLGAFLSGGIDSTIIAGLMQRHSERPVQTFSIGFPVAQFDERRYAREAAAHLGTEHHEFVVEPQAVAILPKLAWHYDEPFADSSAIPTMYLSEVTRRHVTVALSGDGGDELFAGYDRYRAVALAEKFDHLPRPLRGLLTNRLWQRLPASTRQKSFRRRLKRFTAALGMSPQVRYTHWISVFDAEQRQRILSEDLMRLAGFGDQPDADSFLLDAYRACPDRDFVTRTTGADVLTYLPCDILTKVDIASMSVGLECRSPFLDHHVAELAARMPIGLKLRGGRGKRILTETFADLLPESIRRRPKMGFGVPLDHWFRHELKPLLHEILLTPRALDRGYFQPAAVHSLLEEHTSGRADHSHRLWSLLCFETWHRTYLDGPPPAECPTTL